MKKIKKVLFKDGVLLTDKRLWTIGIGIALILAAMSIIPAIIKLASL